MEYANILFIDDDEDDLDIFSSIARSLLATANTHTANDAGSALAQLDAGEMSPDLIFLDLNMPAMNGRDFLRAVKAKPALRDIPVIVMSTTGQADTVREVKTLCAANYIIKPSSFSELTSVFKKILKP